MADVNTGLQIAENSELQSMQVDTPMTEEQSQDTVER